MFIWESQISFFSWNITCALCNSVATEYKLYIYSYSMLQDESMQRLDTSWLGSSIMLYGCQYCFTVVSIGIQGNTSKVTGM